RFIKYISRVTVIPDELNPVSAEADEEAVHRMAIWLLAREKRRSSIDDAGFESHAGDPRVVAEIVTDVHCPTLLRLADELEPDVFSKHREQSVEIARVEERHVAPE